ncbi:MAG TPA: lipid A deacylase LpxR family protein [Puia sp.]|nr:lipid A deacylase LpxR family protein [Puia sp.]
MRGIAPLLFTFFFFGAGRLCAQQPDTPTHMIRIYEDDDFINIWGQGTDNAYTNGTRLDYFYNLQHPSRFFIDKALPKAGAGSVNTYGWGIVQLMYTPDDLTSSAYNPHDYPYSGALFASHTLFSYNPVKKYSFQSELVLGVIGPAALAGPTQRLVHGWEGFDIPKGWGHQFSNDLLLNINVTAEKQLAQAGNALEIIAGGQVSAGTMQNSLTVYPLIRFGNMTGYFDGFLSQYTSTGSNRRGKRKGQFYFFVKPAAQLIFTNALVQGGVFTRNPNLHPGDGKPSDTTGGQTSTTAEPPPPAALPYPPINKLQASLTYGAVFNSGNFSLSLSQITSSAQLKGLYCHQTGNISLYFSW